MRSRTPANRRQALLYATSAAGLLSHAAFPGYSWSGLSSYNITGQPIEEVAVTLGSADGDLVFDPPTIELTAGRLTKLQFSNPSPQTHYFTALEFADKVYSVLVLAGDPAVEVKGKVQEVALKGGAAATWILLPIKAGTYPLRCTVNGHTEGGMVGTIIVKEPPAQSNE